MVVIVIIGLLATLVVPNVMPAALFKSQAKIAKVDIASICSALDNFAVENGGKYPESLEVLVTPDENGITYLKDQTSIPLDPWKNEYVYEPPRGGTGPTAVISYGKDGHAGRRGRRRGHRQLHDPRAEVSRWALGTVRAARAEAGFSLIEMLRGRADPRDAATSLTFISLQAPPAAHRAQQRRARAGLDAARARAPTPSRATPSSRSSTTSRPARATRAATAW